MYTEFMIADWLYLIGHSINNIPGCLSKYTLIIIMIPIIYYMFLPNICSEHSTFLRVYIHTYIYTHIVEGEFGLKSWNFMIKYDE